MASKNASEMLATAIILSDEVSRLIRSSVNDQNAVASLELAANKANQLQHLCTKTKREIKANN